MAAHSLDSLCCSHVRIGRAVPEEESYESVHLVKLDQGLLELKVMNLLVAFIGFSQSASNQPDHTTYIRRLALLDLKAYDHFYLTQT